MKLDSLPNPPLTTGFQERGRNPHSSVHTHSVHSPGMQEEGSSVPSTLVTTPLNYGEAERTHSLLSWTLGLPETQSDVCLMSVPNTRAQC